MTHIPSSGWHARLQLGFTDNRGKTEFNCGQSQAPLKVQRPFYPEGNRICHSAILHTAGGVVGGDRLEIDLDLAPQAHALVTTVAASKIYRSLGSTAQQAIAIAIASQAVLEWLPQETILFNGADFRTQTRVDLAPGAVFLGWDLTRLGRTARGERFSQGQWRSQLEVWQNGTPLWIDRSGLTGGSPLLESPYGLAGQPVIGTLVWLGKSLDALEMKALRELEIVNFHEFCQVGMTFLPDGLICRYRGRSTTEAKRWFMTIWRHLRRQTWGLDTQPSRLWPV